MQMQETERLLREMIAEAKVAEDTDRSRTSLIEGLFSKPERTQPDWPQPPRAQFPRMAKKADRRSDIVTAALGITLGLICAMFPWYVFYSDIKITTHGLHLGGKGSRAGRILSDEAGNKLPPLSADDVTAPELDLFPTATTADAPQEPDKTPGLDKQPFPSDAGPFELVHVANGRAMIEDDSGLWLVQRGSRLPDNSTVSSIEQRGGKWVIVTSADKVIELAK